MSTQLVVSAVIFLTSLLVKPVSATTWQEERVPITSENVNKLKLHFIAEGCGAFSENGSVMVTQPFHSDTMFVYDTATGQLRFSLGVDRYTEGVLSPDGSLLAVATGFVPFDYPEIDGLYDLSTGQRLLAVSSGSMQFSPDGALLAVGEDGVYNIESGERTFEFDGRNLVFSPDGSVLAAGEIVYDVEIGQPHFTLPTIQVRNLDILPALLFSQDSSLLVASGVGVYDVETGERRFEISPESRHVLDSNTTFSPDGTLLAVGNDGVYEVSSGRRLFTINGSVSPKAFSSDGSALLVNEDGVYDVVSGTLQFSISGRYPIFSPDGMLVASDGDGMYDVESGTRLYPLRYIVYGFSADGSLFLAYGGLYDTETGRRRFLIPFPASIGRFSPDSRFVRAQLYSYAAPSICAVFAISDGDARGLVAVPRGVNIRRSPGLNAPIVSSTTEGENFYAYARTSDNGWYRIGERQWVAAEVVRVVYMPDDLPIF